MRRHTRFGETRLDGAIRQPATMKQTRSLGRWCPGAGRSGTLSSESTVWGARTVNRAAEPPRWVHSLGLRPPSGRSNWHAPNDAHLRTLESARTGDMRSPISR